MDIVICEDCPARAGSIRRRLEREGHVVSGIFHSIEDCLARCAHLPPDSVVLGPGMAQSPDAGPLTAGLQALGLTATVVPDPTPCPGSPHLGPAGNPRSRTIG